MSWIYIQQRKVKLIREVEVLDPKQKFCKKHKVK